ncbi:MAG: hypothetical protein AAF916_01335 [Planctomycetota bacterium]
MAALFSKAAGRTDRTKWLTAIGAFACLSLSTPPGCTIASVPFAGFEDYTVPAQYTLPARSTVLIVEARSRVSVDETFARHVAARAQAQLDRNLVTPSDGKPATGTPDEPGLSLVSNAEVAKFQDLQGDAYYRMAIDRLGRELGADTVIYAKVAKAALNDDGPVLQPDSRIMVRVIDARTGQRLWPEATAGLEDESTAWPLSSGGVHQTTTASEVSGTTRDRAWRSLADEAGLDLARLFYTWQRPQPGAKAEAEKQRIQREKRSNEAAVQ